jgi:hypothetical protein
VEVLDPASTRDYTLYTIGARDGSVSMFSRQRLNTEKQNNRGTVRHGDLYSVQAQVIVELVHFIRDREPSFGIRQRTHGFLRKQAQSSVAGCVPDGTDVNPLPGYV